MHLSCCTWALAGGDSDESQILPRLAGVGFGHVDIRPHDFTSAASLAQLQSLGMSVLCVGLSFAIPQGAALGSANAGAAATALHHATLALARASSLGATTTYIIPDLDATSDGLLRYGRAVATLADRAAGYGIKLCIEHFPGRALPTVANTLAFLEDVGHGNLQLLFDIGHAQMSREDARKAVLAANKRLGYVHLDDNDGVGDLHWALFDGVMTEASLDSLFDALDEIGYDGGVSLEMSPALPDPLDAIHRSRINVVRIRPAFEG